MTYTTKWSGSESWPRFGEFNHDFWFGQFQAAYGGPVSTMPRERIDRERASWPSWIGGFPARNAGNSCEHVARGKSSGCYQLESTFHSGTSERSHCVRRHFTLVHVRGQGSEEPQSPQETRPVLDKQSRVATICRSKVTEQTRSRTRERTHECVSEFVSLAHASLGTKQ